MKYGACKTPTPHEDLFASPTPVAYSLLASLFDLSKCDMLTEPRCDNLVEDISDADAIMDWLDERKIIEMEWRRIQDMMESARNLEMAVKGGADRDD
jgi:hypothetical protein